MRLRKKLAVRLLYFFQGSPFRLFLFLQVFLFLNLHLQPLVLVNQLFGQTADFLENSIDLIGIVVFSFHYIDLDGVQIRQYIVHDNARLNHILVFISSIIAQRCRSLKRKAVPNSLRIIFSVEKSYGTW